MPDSLCPVVAVHDPGAAYGPAPFHPDRPYLELGALGAVLDPSNTAYNLVRASLACYDRENVGTDSWNPLGHIIKPGQRVVIKPNLVLHRRSGLQELTTHASIIRCVLDYTCLALRGRGRVVVCDAPIQGADFARLVTESGLDQVVALYRNHPNVEVLLIDLRSEWARVDDASAYIHERVSLPGDPAGNTQFDLAAESALEPISGPGSHLAVGDYSSLFTSENHQQGRHRYRFSNTVLEADVVLNLAKMKTHQKAGITGALKNVVGMNTSKDFLPHFRVGPPPRGDEFPKSAYNRLASRAKASLQERIPLPLWRTLRFGAETLQGLLRRRSGGDARYGLLSGSWEGNDTIWRMVIDINRIARFGDRRGRLLSTPQRTVYHFVDGIVAGEGEGPLRSTPRGIGLFMHGSDAAALDALAAALMGFDPLLVPLLREASAIEHGLTAPGGPGAASVLVNETLADRLRLDRHFGFAAPRGWPSLGGSVPAGLLQSVGRRARTLPETGPQPQPQPQQEHR